MSRLGQLHRHLVNSYAMQFLPRLLADVNGKFCFSLQHRMSRLQVTVDPDREEKKTDTANH